jgi:hypothetical protein
VNVLGAERSEDIPEPVFVSSFSRGFTKVTEVAFAIRFNSVFSVEIRFLCGRLSKDCEMIKVSLRSPSVSQLRSGLSSLFCSRTTAQ